MRTEEYYNELIRQAKNKIAEKNDIKTLGLFYRRINNYNWSKYPVSLI